MYCANTGERKFTILSPSVNSYHRKGQATEIVSDSLCLSAFSIPVTFGAILPGECQILQPPLASAHQDGCGSEGEVERLFNR